MGELVVLKIGGSIVTDRSSESPRMAGEERLRRISEEIRDGWEAGGKRLVVIHGAGSYGHPIVKRTGIHEGAETEEDRLAFAETQRLQTELSSIVTDYLIDAGLPAFPVQPSAVTRMSGDEMEEMYTDVIEGLLEAGMVPVLNGVPAYDSERACSILSGDDIAPFLAEELGAELVIHATDTDGVYTADPSEDPEAERIEEVSGDNIDEVLRKLSGSGHTDVTGGMAGKVEKVMEGEVECRIVSALEEGNLTEALIGGDVGTLIRP